ncbi:MAG: protein-glutamate O-methyltransferase CheR [Planctomycetes bacterium]|nr:protein-glutamate O-methyltransferase CheR [Planctomycetota bacterium]
MDSDPSGLSDEDFRFFTGLIHRRFGINLTQDKRTLLVGRLTKMLREKGIPDFHAYRQLLEGPDGEAELDELVNRISTNFTFFFREPAHFDFFRTVALPEMKARHDCAGSRDLRVWCAAASSGEEPCSIAIAMREFFGTEYGRWSGGLLATDISAQALGVARCGVYPEDRLENMPAALRNRYFTRAADGEGWQVSQAILGDITYRRLNLMNENLPFKSAFDVIFCRNVMIYFDQATRDALVDRLARLIVPGGYLFIGHSESIGRGHAMLDYIKPATYRRI